MAGTFYINGIGTKLSYQGTGRMADNVLIISANAQPFGKHDLHCDLSNPAHSKCYYYQTSPQPEPVQANITVTWLDDKFIELIWTENSTQWEIEGELPGAVMP